MNRQNLDKPCKVPLAELVFQPPPSADDIWILSEAQTLQMRMLNGK